MAVDEVTNWATTPGGNQSPHPVGPQGRDATRIAWTFRDIMAAIARWRDAGGAGSGSWEQLSGSPFTPTNTQTYAITWDESLYNAMVFHYEDLETDTDNSTFYCSLGSNNGGTIYNSSGDYDGFYHVYTPFLTALSDSTIVRLGTAWGNDTGEGVSGRLELFAMSGSNNGALLKNASTFKNTAAAIVNQYTEAAFEGSSVAIDTLRFEVQGGAAFEASGSIWAYGLTK